MRASIGRRDGGFTLIELLVVIVILGVLAGVVVFAVRGAGDKGSTEAIATDERILRTALELYCAKHSRYPIDPEPPDDRDAMQVLVDEKFLSGRSKYHSLQTGSGSEGNCNGDRYQLGGPNGGAQEPQTPRCVEQAANSWCKTNAFTETVLYMHHPNTLVPLPGGKVLALVLLELENGEEAVGTRIYDPAAESWTHGATRPGNAMANTIVPIDGDTVLVHFYRSDSPTGGWWLYHPNDPVATQWDQLKPTEGTPRPRNTDAKAVQLTGGQVLIIGQGDRGFSGTTLPPTAELYDPTANEISDIGNYGECDPHFYDEPVRLEAATCESFSGAQLVLLEDGRVLMVGAKTTFTREPACPTTPLNCPETAGSSSLVAKIFDPAPPEPPPGEERIFWSEVAAPPIAVNKSENQPVVLPNGRVLVLGSNSNSTRKFSIYRPGDNNTWTDASDYACAGSGGCYILAQLPGGRVLAHGNGGSNASERLDEGSTQTFFFDPDGGGVPWTPGPALESSKSPGAGVFLDPNRGGCGHNCGKVLVVGDGSAELLKLMRAS